MQSTEFAVPNLNVISCGYSLKALGKCSSLIDCWEQCMNPNWNTIKPECNFCLETMNEYGLCVPSNNMLCLDGSCIGTDSCCPIQDFNYIVPLNFVQVNYIRRLWENLEDTYEFNPEIESYLEWSTRIQLKQKFDPTGYTFWCLPWDNIGINLNPQGVYDDLISDDIIFDPIGAEFSAGISFSF